MDPDCKKCSWYFAAKDYCKLHRFRAGRFPGCGFRSVGEVRNVSTDIRQWL